MAIDITYANFVKRYLKPPPKEFRWQTTPLQIYPLQHISNYLILPTPLLKTDYHNLIYLEQGSYCQRIGMESYTISAPSILYIPEGEAFSIKSKHGELEGFYILLEHKVISSIIRKVELSDLFAIKTLVPLNKEINQWMNTLCGLLHDEITSDTPNRKVGNGLLQALFQKLIALASGGKTVSRQSEIANNFKQWLTKSVSGHKSVAYYAQQLNVTENYLNRCVKARFSKSCKQLIQETSILQSQLLLLETSKDISEISFMMGYNDPSYFSRVFKKVTGQTPSEFKQQVMHDLS